MVSENRILKVGVILPHTKVFGGVKRFMEIGNIFVEVGHSFTLFTPDASFLGWFPYKGMIKTINDLQITDLDVLFFGEPDFLDLVKNNQAKRKVFYLINPKAKVRAIVKCKNIELFANSSGIEKSTFDNYKVSSFSAYGGINLSLFKFQQPVEKKIDEPFVVMAYGRISKPKKGTMEVVKACEQLHKKGIKIQLLLFDTPTDKKADEAIKKFSTKVPYEFVLNHPVSENQSLYHRADVFVSAETSGGWSNTTAEAMACGTPVISTNVGTQDFLVHQETGILLHKGKSSYIAKAIEIVMADFEMRKQFSEKGRKQIEKFDWEVLTKKIINHLIG